jgi:hypothetical protein
MFTFLAVGAALAGPLQLGLAIGPAIGGGESTLGSYTTLAPATAIDLTWHLGPFETWAGASASLLMAGVGDRVVPSSLLEAEIGVGLGGRALGAGIYGGNGYPGPIGGLYGRLTWPGPTWCRRVGIEGRAFYTPATDSSGLALMARIEPGRHLGGPRRDERGPPRQPDPAEPPPPYPPPPPYGAGDQAPAFEGAALPPDDASAPAEGGAGLAIPEDGAPPAAPTPTETHHDEPY